MSILVASTLLYLIATVWLAMGVQRPERTLSRGWLMAEMAIVRCGEAA